MKHRDLLVPVEAFFSDKVRRLGPTPEGADYNSRTAQETRFAQFLRLLDPAPSFTLNDYGCGYGALAHYLKAQGRHFSYCGFDLSAPMIAHARQATPPGVAWEFSTDPAHLVPADYTVACGIFNLKFDAAPEGWLAYILDTLEALARLSRLGFGFNMLTRYADPEKMRADLYYGDPLFFFDHCLRRFSRHVALLHDYRLYDFTVLVRLV